jgi:hypothetical protein
VVQATLRFPNLSSVVVDFKVRKGRVVVLHPVCWVVGGDAMSCRIGLSSSASAGWGCFFQLDQCLPCLHLFGSLAVGDRLSLSLTWIVGAKAPLMLDDAICVGS